MNKLKLIKVTLLIVILAEEIKKVKKQKLNIITGSNFFDGPTLKSEQSSMN